VILGNVIVDRNSAGHRAVRPQKVKEARLATATPEAANDLAEGVGEQIRGREASRICDRELDEAQIGVVREYELVDEEEARE
jgi:hypothetical protein